MQLREDGPVLAVGIAALLAISWFGLRGTSWPDWMFEAHSSVAALLGGHVHTFLQEAPAYGGSLILRAPFMLLTLLWHGGDRAVYRLGAAPCLAATGLLALWLDARLRTTGATRVSRAVAAVLVVANPLALAALQYGHPEELLGAAGCVAAVALAMRDRPHLAGFALGLAIANKPWAVIAAGPVMLGLSRDRGRALATMTVTAVAVLAPFELVRGTGLADRSASVGLSTAGIFQPWQLWWFLGSQAHGSGARTAPTWLGPIGHTLPLVVMPPLCALYAYVTRAHPDRRRGPDLFLLLALLFALRCALDPWDISYYVIPFLFALLTWETSTYRRVPVLTLAATLACLLVLRETFVIASNAEMNLQAAAFAVICVPTLAVIATRLYSPGAPARMLARRSAAAHA